MYTPPTMRKNLTKEQLDDIKRLKEDNLTYESIAKVIKSNANTVKCAFKRMKKNEGLPPKEKKDRSRFNGRFGLAVKKLIINNPAASYKALSKGLKPECATGEAPPSKASVHRFLSKSGYKMFKLVKKPFISCANKSKRIEFAKKFLEKPIEFWDNIVWSDETMVRSNPKKKDIFVKAHNSVSRKNLPVNAKSQNEGPSIMFWGCFCSDGIGPLVPVEGKITAEKYKLLLEKNLLPFLKRLNRPIIFMQDNAPIHKSGLVMKFLADNGIEALLWPPQSPDLNPIENLWAFLKRKRDSEFPMPGSKKTLIDQISEIWNDIDPDFCKKYTRSLKNRLEQVILNKGEAIKY